jgi:hypothetical protein
VIEKKLFGEAHHRYTCSGRRYLWLGWLGGTWTLASDELNVNAKIILAVSIPDGLSLLLQELLWLIVVRPYTVLFQSLQTGSPSLQATSAQSAAELTKVSIPPNGLTLFASISLLE